MKLYCDICTLMTEEGRLEWLIDNNHAHHPQILCTRCLKDYSYGVTTKDRGFSTSEFQILTSPRVFSHLFRYEWNQEDLTTLFKILYVDGFAEARSDFNSLKNNWGFI